MAKGSTAGAQFFKRSRIEERDREEQALLYKAMGGKCSPEETIRQLKHVVTELTEARAKLLDLDKKNKQLAYDLKTVYVNFETLRNQYDALLKRETNYRQRQKKRSAPPVDFFQESKIPPTNAKLTALANRTQRWLAKQKEKMEA